MQLAVLPQLRRTGRPEHAVHPLRDALAAVIEETALQLLDPDRIELMAEDMRLVERHRVHHVGLVVNALVLSTMQRSTHTQGRWLDAQAAYEAIGGSDSGTTSFRNQVRKAAPVLQKLLRQRMRGVAASASSPELRGRLRDFADVLIPDGCGFKLAAALSNIYAGTGQPAELKLHAVYSVRDAGVQSVRRTAGSVHDSDGFWPQKWQAGALYLWDLAFVSHERFVAAASAGAHVLQRLKSDGNPIVLASYGAGGQCRDLVHDDGRPMRLDEACALGFVHQQSILDLDVKISHAGRHVVARVVCVPFAGEDRFYLTTLPREIFSPHDIAEMYRMRWEIERFFAGWKGALRLDEVRRLKHPVSLEVAVTASLLGAVLAQRITAVVNDLEQRAADAAASP